MTSSSYARCAGRAARTDASEEGAVDLGTSNLRPPHHIRQLKTREGIVLLDSRLVRLACSNEFVKLDMWCREAVPNWLVQEASVGCARASLINTIHKEDTEDTTTRQSSIRSRLLERFHQAGHAASIDCGYWLVQYAGLFRSRKSTIN
jgi:hypothetical protein